MNKNRIKAELEIIKHSIKRTREKNGLSQTQLAKLTKISYSMIRSIERGARVPSLENYIVLKNKLGLK